MTAPTPERRVGEARVAELAALEIVDEALGLSAEVQCQRILYNEKVRVARDLLDERAANALLTAEVERLRGALVKVRAHTAHTKASPDELHIGLLASIERIADAALSLPTPAPEATE